MELFPAIDLRDGRVVRLLKGDYDQQTTYADDPVAQAKAFAGAGARWLHVVDLDGARTGRMKHLDTIGDVCRRVPLGVQVGGGVRDVGCIDRLLAAGVRQVVLGTSALSDWAWFEGLMGVAAYQGRLVLGLDAREGELAVGGWERQLEVSALEVARRVCGWPLAAIVYTDIATDGTMVGPNMDGTRSIAEATDVPVIASGGVGNLEHLRALRRLPIRGAIVGRALYEQAFTLEQALAVFEEGG